MDANLDFVKRVYLPRFGVFFCRKRFEAALALLVYIIDNPGLFFFTGPGRPFTLPDACHV
jgi:hypothetical protein